ncbi:protein of unknown function DUF99 [Nitrosococcus halophilus Nc 4]|uniref:Uncharacterized protein n=1 Tax=Nitrosococcus halophilus (strain Nc4) TaxID=472759 RepID=D5BWK5_NITHN|nr:DUF99 family protein [Nitrosococcus halophilus]ADE15662.1 protein of unknown function DUF99 [Nitrosococcus halophilus Nc 4]
MVRSLSHVIGFDDAPFPAQHHGDVLVVGAVYSAERLDGVLSGKVRRDGVNSTQTLIRLITASRFFPHTQLLMLQGIALAGFNVVDLHHLYQATGIPVLVIARRAPNFTAIKKALLNRVPGGRRKWALIERAGPPELVAGIYIQRVGLPLAVAEATIRRFAIHSIIPEPLRTAHIIAGGVVGGGSRQRV